LQQDPERPSSTGSRVLNGRLLKELTSVSSKAWLHHLQACHFDAEVPLEKVQGVALEQVPLDETEFGPLD
jgi:hypothetical protein